MLIVPLHISLLFIALVFVIAFFFFITIQAYARRTQLSETDKTKLILTTLFSILLWLIFTLVLTQTGFLQNFNAMPPRILVVLLPPLLITGLLFCSKKFMAMVEQVDQFWLIYPQSFRIVMEIILWLLYRYQVIPQQMTFEGRNFDVLAGLSAPFVAYYCFRKKTWPPVVALIWNFAGLALLLNIVIVAMLSTPYPMRYFMNEPANTVVFTFPFVWLPAFVVPFAFCLHVLSIYKLLRKKQVAAI